jgi:type VI secretion system protein ImpK
VTRRVPDRFASRRARAVLNFLRDHIRIASMSPTSAPSLIGAAASSAGASAASSAAALPDPRSLPDLFYQGFYMVFLLRNGYAPSAAGIFRERVKQLLADVDRGAQKLGVPADDVFQAKFAFCALVDEIVLMSKLRVRDEWERHPLQLEMFGEHRAGERFFEVLEVLRGEGARRVQVLEVFHMGLLLGFQGRYILEGSEKLGWLTARLGDEIVHLQGRRAPFAPHWAPPDKVVHRLRSEVPAWVMASVFAALGLVAFLGLRAQLGAQTGRDLGRFTEVVKLAPQPAYVTITLP